jgi:Bromodomain
VRVQLPRANVPASATSIRPAQAKPGAKRDRTSTKPKPKPKPRPKARREEDRAFRIKRSAEADAAQAAPAMKRSRRAGRTVVAEDEVFIDTEEGSIPVSALKGAALSAEDKRELETVLRAVVHHQYGWMFAQAVDPVSLGIPDYYDKIQTPMDLGTVGQKLTKRRYRSVADFEADVHLVFRNAVVYNGAQHEVGLCALELERVFHAEMDSRLGDRGCTVSALSEAPAGTQTSKLVVRLNKSAVQGQGQAPAQAQAQEQGQGQGDVGNAPTGSVAGVNNSNDTGVSGSVSAPSEPTETGGLEKSRSLEEEPNVES